MYPYIKCFTCNNELGSKYILFSEMRHMKNEENLDKNEKIDLLDIFELLDITNNCCKNRIANVCEFNRHLYDD
jgi:DNA-directed RNA polymerase subunit N (RpoN/RPB10)